MSFTGIFAIGVSSLTAFAKGIEAISGNVANADTTGYKRVRTDFEALLSTSRNSGGFVSAGSAGSGVAAEARQLFSEQGAVTRNNQATHVAVAGAGWFIVSRTPQAASAGDLLYTRAGDFRPDANGDLVNSAGFYLQGTTSASGDSLTAQGLQTVNVNRLPAGADASSLGALVSVEIGSDGGVDATYANGSVHRIYRIPLALFTNESGLALADRTAVSVTAQSGEAEIAAAGAGRAGAIEGAALEGSTVDIGTEFSSLIATQRAYATGARILRTADELWRTLVSTAA
jgi:flagellar hook protein FlgE